MNINLSDISMGIPMMFPVTWEENVAANMVKIPMFEFFPGVMVMNLYKSYRVGIEGGYISPMSSDINITPPDSTVGYLSQVTGKTADIVADFLHAMVVTVKQGKASPDILIAKELTGIAEKIPAVTSEATKAATFPLSMVAIIAVAGLVVYGMGIGILPKPKFRGNR